jgi:hypothetical protein
MIDAALAGNGTVAVLALDRIMEQGEDGVSLVGAAVPRTGGHEGRDGFGYTLGLCCRLLQHCAFPEQFFRTMPQAAPCAAVPPGVAARQA